MKLTCTQENLSQGLNIVSHIGEKAPDLPILNNVLLRAKKDGLLLTSTNLEIGIKTLIRGKIDEEGDFTVQTKLLTDFVNSLKKENVSIVKDENQLQIKGENHQTSIRGLTASDFPVIPEVDRQDTVEAQINKFRKALSQIVFSMSADESRQELNGAFLQFNTKRCILAATDSYRLSESTIDIINKSKKEISIIVPAKTLQELLRILEGSKADILRVSVNDNQVLFAFDETEIVSRVIAGNYPDYRQIIPKTFKNEVKFPVTEMVQAIKTTSLFCKQGINDVRLTLEKRFSDLAVRAENSTFGKNTSNIKSLSKGQEMDIVFNYRFLLDGLLHLTDDKAILKTNDATSPALLCSERDNNFLYVIMPIRQ
jgi:DNA polymerase III subunit beta